MSKYVHYTTMSLKGGVGKTSILAAFARQLSGRVSLFDLDYSNPVLNIALGIDHARHTPLKNFRIAPVPWEKGEIASLSFLTVPGSIIRQSSDHRCQAIEDFIVSLAWKPYDWLLIDTAPALSQENETILKHLNPDVIVCAEPGPLAKEGVIRTVLFLETVGARLLGIVGNKGLGGELAEELGVQFLGTVPYVKDLTKVEVPDFTRFKAVRLGEPGLVKKLKRAAMKLGIDVILAREE